MGRRSEHEAEKRSGLKDHVAARQGTRDRHLEGNPKQTVTVPMQGDVEIGGKQMHDSDIDAGVSRRVPARPQHAGHPQGRQGEGRHGMRRESDGACRERALGLTHLAIALKKRLLKRPHGAICPRAGAAEHGASSTGAGGRAARSARGCRGSAAREAPRAGGERSAARRMSRRQQRAPRGREERSAQRAIMSQAHAPGDFRHRAAS